MRLIAALVAATAGIAAAQPRIVGADGSRLVEIDPNTGVATQMVMLTGAAFGTMGALAYDPATDTLYGTSSSNSIASLFRIDYTTGVVTLIGPFGAGSIFMHGLEFDSRANRLYATSSASATAMVLYELNPSSGAATVIGTNPGRVGFGSLGFDSSTGTMYWSDTGSDELYRIDTATAAMTLVGPHGIASQIGGGMAYHPTLGMLGSNNSGTDNLSRIDLATGAATLIGNTTTSNMLAIAVINRSAGCRVDLNGDGISDFNDYLVFLNLYNANDLRVDYNGDGIVDFNDYLEFLNLYNVGC